MSRETDELAAAARHEIRKRDAEIARLTAALKPFAKLADEVKARRPGWDHDEFYFDLLGGVMTLAPFRKARAVLGPSNDEQSTREG